MRKPIIYKTKKAILKQADSFISVGEKFFWAPQGLLIIYVFKLNDISKFNNELFFLFIFISYGFIYIGKKLIDKGLLIYEDVYKPENIDFYE